MLIMNKNKLDDTAFNASKEGKVINKRLNRLRFTGSLCLVVGLIYLIINIIFKEEWYEYISPVLLFIFGPFFIYDSYSLKKTKVNVFNYYHGKRNK